MFHELVNPNVVTLAGMCNDSNRVKLSHTEHRSSSGLYYAHTVEFITETEPLIDILGNSTLLSLVVSPTFLLLNFGCLNCKF